jgi:HEAT repeat protein
MIGAPKIAERFVWAAVLTMVAAPGCATKGRSRLSRLSWRRPPTLEALQDVSPAERLSALRHVAKGGGVAADEVALVAEKLRQMYTAEQEATIRAEIVRAASAVDHATSAELARSAIQDPEADVRIAVCEYWSRHPGDESIRQLSGILSSDTNTDVRLAAARALGRTESSAAIQPLATLLDDRDPAITYVAMQSMRRVSGQNLGNDVRVWKEFAQGKQPAERPKLVERIRNVF